MSIEDEAYDESKWFNEVSQKFKTNNKTVRLNSKNGNSMRLLNQ